MIRSGLTLEPSPHFSGDSLLLLPPQNREGGLEEGGRKPQKFGIGKSWIGREGWKKEEEWWGEGMPAALFFIIEPNPPPPLSSSQKFLARILQKIPQHSREEGEEKRWIEGGRLRQSPLFTLLSQDVREGRFVPKVPFPFVYIPDSFQHTSIQHLFPSPSSLCSLADKGFRDRDKLFLPHGEW